MESVFCLEIAVDELKFRKGVQCNVPFVSVVFLKFPTVVIRLNKAKHQKSNHYSFQTGKSCLFKMSSTLLYEQLTSTPIYFLVLDQELSSDSTVQQQCVGTSAVDLKKAITQILTDIQKCGMNRSSSFGESVTVALCNIMQDTIGYIEIAYKLTCFGQNMLPHLSKAVMVDERCTAEQIKFEMPAPCEHTDGFEDEVMYPPRLYYQAEKVEKQSSKVCVSVKPKSKENENPDQLSLEMTMERKKILTEWKNKTQTFIEVRSSSAQKSEATQTNLEHLNQFPILQSLINEVVKLGLHQPVEVAKGHDVSKAQTKPLQQEVRKRKASSLSIVKAKTSPRKQLPHSKQIQKQKSLPKSATKKKYPLSYGLTKSHLLRLSLNKQPGFSQTYTKSKIVEKPRKSYLFAKKSKRKHSHHLVSTYTQTMDDFTGGLYESQSDDFDTDNESVELPLAFTNVKSVDDLSLSPDKSSPRVLSRQSIEIRLPSALTEEPPEDEKEDYSSKYRYSDDFDEDHSSTTSSSHVTSVTAVTVDIESSPQLTSYDTITKDETEISSPHRLSVSPQPTVSDLSPVTSFGITPRDSIPEEPEREYLESVMSTVDEEKSADIDIVESASSPQLLDLPSSPEIASISPKDRSPKYESQDDDSKPTDDSAASNATAVMATKLPIPAPSSDSPVIRSLVSEPGGRKPRPPRVSHSSSMERIHRKFRKSSESFQISDLSDVRTSELADIKTSDLSDLKSTADSISPIHSTDALASNISLPNLLKKKK